MKKLLVIVLAGLALFSYGQQRQEQATPIVNLIGIKELLTNGLGYHGKEVSVRGIISHVCRHSGDKMRVAEIDGEGLSVLVMLKDNSGSFSPESEGTELVVTGSVVARIRNLGALGKDHHPEQGSNHSGGHVCKSTEKAIRLMKEKGIDPDIAVYIDLVSYQKM